MRLRVAINDASTPVEAAAQLRELANDIERITSICANVALTRPVVMKGKFGELEWEYET